AHGGLAGDRVLRCRAPTRRRQILRRSRLVERAALLAPLLVDGARGDLLGPVLAPAALLFALLDVLVHALVLVLPAPRHRSPPSFRFCKDRARRSLGNRIPRFVTKRARCSRNRRSPGTAA